MGLPTSVVPFVRPFKSAVEIAHAMHRCRDRSQASLYAARALQSAELADKLSLHSFALLALIPRLAIARGPRQSGSPSSEADASDSLPTKDLQELVEVLVRETRDKADFDEKVEEAAINGLHQLYKPLLGTDWGKWILASTNSLEVTFGQDDPVKALAACYRQFFHYSAQGNPWCGLLPAGLVDDVWRSLWSAGAASARFGVLGEGLDWVMGESPRVWPWSALEGVREALDSSRNESTAMLIGWLIADAMAEEDHIDEIDQVLIRSSHPESRVRGTLLESIARTEAGEAWAEPALTAFAGWLGRALTDYRFDWARVVRPSFEECLSGYRATELMNIQDVTEWSANVDHESGGEDVRFIGLLARSCSYEEGLTALPSSVKNLVERGMFRAADALLAAALLQEIQSDDDRHLDVLTFIEYRALLPSNERLYIDRAIASLDNGCWGERGKVLKDSFGRFIRVGDTPRLSEADLSGHDKTVRRYLQNARRQVDRAEEGEEEAAGNCMLALAKAAEFYLHKGKATLKGKAFAGKLMLGALLAKLKEEAKKADEAGETDRHWYQRLFNDRALSGALDSLNSLRSAAAHHSPQKVTASEARSHWHTWVSEGQLSRLREIVDGA